jgi:hypothetical protein
VERSVTPGRGEPTANGKTEGERGTGETEAVMEKHRRAPNAVFQTLLPDTHAL